MSTHLVTIERRNGTDHVFVDGGSRPNWSKRRRAARAHFQHEAAVKLWAMVSAATLPPEVHEAARELCAVLGVEGAKGGA